MKDNTPIVEENLKPIVDAPKVEAPKPAVNPKKLSAGEYNREARDSGRKDWASAYKTDVIDIPAPQVIKTPDETITPPAGEIQSQDINKPKIETPKPEKTNQKTEQDYSLSTWKSKGSTIEDLEELVEGKYGTIATQKDGRLTANVNGIDYEWSIDSAGNSIKKQLDSPAQEVVRSRDEVVSEFTGLIESNASLDELTSYINSNSGYEREFRNIFKNHYTNTKNFEYVQRYDRMTPQQLQTAVNNRDIVIGNKQYDLLSDATKNTLNQANNLAYASEKINFTQDETVTAVINSANQMETFFGGGIAEKVEELNNNPEITRVRTELEAERVKITDIEDSIEFIEDEMRKKYPHLSKSDQDAIISVKQRALYRKRNNLLNGYNSKFATYTDMKGDIDREIEAYKYDDAQNRATYQIALAQFNTDRARMDKFKLAEFQEQNRQLAVEQQQTFTLQMKEIDQQFASDNKSPSYMTDSDGNLISIIKGISTKVMDIQGEVVSITKEKGYTDSTKYNSDLAQYVTTRTYDDKRLPDFFTSDIGGNSSTNLPVFDTISAITGKPGKYGDENGVKGQIGIYQCGEGVNYYLKESGVTSVHMGSKYEDKKDAINNQAPQVGGLAVWNPPQGNGKGSEYGHVGIVTGYDATKNTVEITDWNAQRNGKKTGEKDTYTIPVSQVVNSDGGFVHLDVKSESQGVSLVDISIYNSNTFKPESLKTTESKAKYADYLSQKDEVFSAKDAKIEDILRFSSGGKELTDSTIGSLTKFDSVIDQLSGIQEQISDMETGPVVGKLAGLNPYNTDAQVLKAQLTALIPNLARGVYGEVGVLTDNDIKLYSKTIPNLESTAEVNKAVLAMTLKIVAGGYKKQLQNLAAAGKDVSGFSGLYDNLIGQVEALETDIGLHEIGVENSTQSSGGQSIMPGVYDWRQGIGTYKENLDVDYIFKQ